MLSLSFSLKLVFVFDLDLTWRTREGNRKITSLWLKWTPRTGQSKLGREMIPSYDNELLRDFISRGVSFRRRLLYNTKKERFSLPLVSFSFSRSDSLIKRKRKKKREAREKQTGISRNKSSWDTKNTDVSDVSFRTKYREDAWEGKTWVLISFLSLKEREGFLSFKSLWRIQVLSSQSKILLSLSLPLLFPIIITNNISIIINMSSFLPSSWSPPSSGFLLPDQVKLQSQKKKRTREKRMRRMKHEQRATKFVRMQRMASPSPEEILMHREDLLYGFVVVSHSLFHPLHSRDKSLSSYSWHEKLSHFSGRHFFLHSHASFTKKMMRKETESESGRWINPMNEQRGENALKTTETSSLLHLKRCLFYMWYYNNNKMPS